MSRRRINKRASSSRSEYDYQAFATNEDGSKPVPRGLSKWPVVECYVPIEEVWRASGCGSVCVVREQPDGRWVFSCFGISLIEDGLCMMFGKDDVLPDKLDTLLDKMGTAIPPMTSGPIEVASEYVWGAWVFGEERGCHWPPDATRKHSAIIPKPPGTRKDWKKRLVGPGGLTPPELVTIIHNNETPEGMPDGKEVVVLTEMTFSVADTGAVVDLLHRKRPAFLETSNTGNAVSFDWTREHPRRGLGGALGFGKRQVLGSVLVEHPDRLVAIVKTLTWAARLGGELESMFGDDIRLLDTRWDDLSRLRAAH